MTTPFPVWSIADAQVSTLPVNGLTGVVVSVSWRVTVVDPLKVSDEGHPIIQILPPPPKGVETGTVQLVAPDANTFVAQNLVTAADLISWAKAAMGSDAVAAAEASAAASYDLMANPPSISFTPAN